MTLVGPREAPSPAFPRRHADRRSRRPRRPPLPPTTPLFLELCILVTDRNAQRWIVYRRYYVKNGVVMSACCEPVPILEESGETRACQRCRSTISVPLFAQNDTNRTMLSAIRDFVASGVHKVKIVRGGMM